MKINEQVRKQWQANRSEEAEWRRARGRLNERETTLTDVILSDFVYTVSLRHSVSNWYYSNQIDCTARNITEQEVKCIIVAPFTVYMFCVLFFSFSSTNNTERKFIYVYNLLLLLLQCLSQSSEEFHCNRSIKSYIKYSLCIDGSIGSVVFIVYWII